MYAALDDHTSVESNEIPHVHIVLFFFFSSYLLQFCVNFFQDLNNCSLMHFAPHLLKTLELFNYSFNVFISIVSGKHGRHELFQMLLCRTRRFHSKYPLAVSEPPSVFIKLQDQQRSSQQTDRPSKSTHRLLLTNEYS